MITIGFAKPEGGTGGYARFIAICPLGWKYGQTVAQAPGAPLPKQTFPLQRDAKGVLGQGTSVALKKKPLPVFQAAASLCEVLNLFISLGPREN